MLRLQIPDREYWDPVKEKFISILEAISKWESKWHIPFHDDRKEKTYEQNIDYIRCMTLTPDVDPLVFTNLTEENVKKIVDYIGDPCTATWFSKSNKKSGKREIITAEIIYYWMTMYNIPESYQRWHINKLMTLLRVAAEKNNPDSKKKSSSALSSQRRMLNEARRRKYHTRG